MKNKTVLHIAASIILIAVGILIPLSSPLKVIIEPASFTLASHVVIFIAMFISPVTAGVVAAGTTIGFFLGGFPLIVVVRAATHILFGVMGAIYIKDGGQARVSPIQMRYFSLCIALFHALSELVVVSSFYFGGYVGDVFYQKGFMTSVLLLVGLGSVIHSLVDFEIALLVMLALRISRQKITKTTSLRFSHPVYRPQG